jgi:hypothetical protein
MLRGKSDAATLEKEWKFNRLSSRFMVSDGCPVWRLSRFKARRLVIVVRLKVDGAGEDCRVADARGCSKASNGHDSKRLFPHSSLTGRQLFLYSLFFFHPSCQMPSVQLGRQSSVKHVLNNTCEYPAILQSIVLSRVSSTPISAG